MKNTLIMFLRLSEIDTAIQDLEESRSFIPENISELEKKIQTLETEVKSTTDKKSDLEVSRSHCQSMIQEKKDWIESREGLVKEIKTNKEYHAALKETATAKKEVSDRETQITALDTQILDVTQKIETLTATSTPQIEALRVQIQELKKSYDALTPDLDDKKKSRNSITVEIDAKAMAFYEQVRSRVTPAISKAENTTCTECGSRIQPQLFNRLFTTSELLSCPRCKRILYVEEVLNKA